MRHVPYSLGQLDIWFPAGGIVWEGVGGMAEGSTSLGQAEITHPRPLLVDSPCFTPLVEDVSA